jgi:hypothetical protein
MPKYLSKSKQDKGLITNSELKVSEIELDIFTSKEEKN